MIEMRKIAHTSRKNFKEVKIEQKSLQIVENYCERLTEMSEMC